MEETEIKLPKAWESFLAQQDFLPVIVKSIERIHDSTWSMKPNRHNHFEVVYMKRGLSVFRVGEQNVVLEPNDMIMIKPYQQHKFTVKSDKSCEFIVLSFLFEDTKGKNISDTSLDDFIEFVNTDQSGAFIHLKLSRKNEIIAVLENILRERERNLMWGDLMAHLLILELFVLISRTLKNEWEQNVKSRSLKIKELLRAAKEYIENNYSKDLTLSDIAKYIFLSESYFAHTFKNEFGISPKSYLLKVRVDASKELLSSTDMKISDIALSVGFSSQQRYNDIFRKYMNMTPLKYRKMEKQRKLNK
ncbi:MAG: AraC family transcriptional regulator [Clostridia bacterium]|nr:AraC family transcriptional regulator [Clostridia bacterium]